MTRTVYFILTALGFIWGILGGSLIGPDPALLFGWLPLSVVSIILTGCYAALINYLYFFQTPRRR